MTLSPANIAINLACSGDSLAYQAQQRDYYYKIELVHIGTDSASN